MRREANAALDEDRIAIDRRLVSISADLRYAGQAFELTTPWEGLDSVDAVALARLTAAFHSAHRQRFSYANPSDPVEIVALRAVATGRLPKPDPAPYQPDRRPARKPDRQVFLGDRWTLAPVWDRDAIRPEHRVEGPAVIEEIFATHWIAKGWTCALGAEGVLVASRTK